MLIPIENELVAAIRRIGSEHFEGWPFLCRRVDVLQGLNVAFPKRRCRSSKEERLRHKPRRCFPPHGSPCPDFRGDGVDKRIAFANLWRGRMRRGGSKKCV